MGLEAKIPNVEWPKMNLIYSAVQFIVYGQPYLRFRFVGGHKEIVWGFAREINAELKHETVRDIELPFFRDEKIQIKGMGSCQLKLGIDSTKRVAEFYGVSGHYQFGIDENHLKSVKPYSQNIDIILSKYRY